MSTPSAVPNIPQDAELRKRTLRKVALRLIPFLALLYFINYLDRTNIGFAGPNGMNEELGLTQAMFGLASGIFFFGYLLLEVPSNLALHKFGARIWIARILITWGILAAALAFVQGPNSLYVLRFLLGVAEAGFFPGIVLYMTFWFPAAERAKAMSLFLLAIPLSSVIGAPLSAVLIEHGHELVFGLSGWRFMYLIEGLPAVLLGLITIFYMTDKPAQAKWLAPDEREWLQAQMDAEDAAIASKHHMKVSKSLTNPRVWGFGLVYFALVYGLYAISFFLPTIIAGFQEQFGVTYSTMDKGLLTAVPFAFAAIVMLFWARHGDMTGERVWHVALPAILAAIVIPLTTFANSPWIAIACVSIFAVGILSGIAAFWPLPSAFLSGAAAAAAIALINSVGNSAGFFAPYITGFLADATGSADTGMWVIGAVLAVGAIITLVLGAMPKEKGAASPDAQ